MFETSKDFLNIALGMSVIVLFGFISWAVYYLVQILRQLFKIFKETRDRITKLDELIKAFKDKIEHSTSHIVLIAEGMKKLVEVIKERTFKKGEDN
jgi:CHASE3 domain sensor protein